jgi:uncharacterized membrane protein HdeD (DUF308 family)
MGRKPRGDPAGLLAGLGRHRGLVLAFGIVNLLVGILVLLWPGRTLVVVAILLLTLTVLLGVWLLVLGTMEVARAFHLRCSAARAAAHIATADSKAPP